MADSYLISTYSTVEYRWFFIEALPHCCFVGNKIMETVCYIAEAACIVVSSVYKLGVGIKLCSTCKVTVDDSDQQ